MGRVLPSATEAPETLVLGSQSAVVTGPKGEEIYWHEYGRVKVHRWLMLKKY